MAPAAVPVVPEPKAEKDVWAGFARTYQRCRDIALKSWADIEGQDLVAATATLFIQAERMGLTVAPKAAPKPPPPPPVDDYPEALEDDGDPSDPY